LLDAALALFVERGFAATRMDDVAQRAGVSKGTVYLYWSAKEELLRAVILRFLGGHLLAGALAIQNHDGKASDLLRHIFVDWWIAIIDSPTSGVFKLMLAEARNFPEIAAFYRRWWCAARSSFAASSKKASLTARCARSTWKRRCSR